MSTTDNHTPPPGSAPPAHKRLERSRHDRVIAGVAGGLGEYFNIDPVIFRIAFVVLVFVGGAAFLLYPAAWLLLPEEGHSRSIGEAWVRHGAHGKWIPIVLIAIGAIVLLNQFDGRDHDGGIGFAVAAIVVGALLLRRRSTPPSGPPAPWETPPAEPEGGSAAPPTSESEGPPIGGGDWGSTAEELQPRSPGGRSLPAIVLSVLLIGGGVAGLLGATGAASVSVPVFLAAAVIFVGLALIVSAWFGGTPGLIAIGIVLTVALAIASVVHAPFTGGWGERRWVPSGLEEVRGRYRLGAGDATIDLSRVTLPPEGRTVRVSIGAGELKVNLPARGRIAIDAHTGVGELRILGHHDDGLDVDQDVVDGDPAYGSLRLVLDMGAGQIQVDRLPYVPPPAFAPPPVMTPPPEPSPPTTPAPNTGAAMRSHEVSHAAA